MVKKTTMNLNDELLAKAKKVAAERGVTLTRLVEDALREELVFRKPKSYTFDWKVHQSRRPPAVDPADREALYDFFDRNP